MLFLMYFSIRHCVKDTQFIFTERRLLWQIVPNVQSIYLAVARRSALIRVQHVARLKHGK